MDSFTIRHVLLFASILTFSTAAAQGSCNACNCQFGNMDVIDTYIEAIVDARLAAAATSQRNDTAPQGTGVTYTIWGRSICPNTTGAQLVYSGRTGGTHFNSRGGSSDKVCLPDNPDYLAVTDGVTVPYYSVVQGSEYEYHAGPLASLTQHNAPCAVCYVSNRSTSIVVPAKTRCPSTWTREYYGYLTTERDTHYRSMYTCLDVNPEVVAGGVRNENPSLFYYTYTDCNGLLCPPYVRNRILACVLCTK